MNHISNLNHTSWECKYHLIWIPKYRKKRIFGEIRQHLTDVLRDLPKRQDSYVVEGRMMPDHVHMLVSIPPKHSVSRVVGFIKGKSAIHIARHFGGCQRNFAGQNFWARGYYVSTVGKDEVAVREYIKRQEQEDRRIDQLRLF